VAVTLSSFRTEYPEFAPTADALVSAKIAAATRRCSATVFGDSYDDAVMLLTAHLLSSAPGGQQGRLEKGDEGDTTYLAEWKRLAQQRGGGAWAIGAWEP